MKFWNWAKLSLLYLPLLFFTIGCSQEMRSNYTPKNMLIGACIGLGIGILARLIGGSGKGGK